MKSKLSISEVAELTGKSRQSVYKQVDKRLSPYVSTIGNQKFIDIKALEEVYGIKVDNQETTNCKPNDNHSDNQMSTNCQPNDNQETTKKLIEMLQNELEVKNKQLEDKDRELAEKDKKIAEQIEQQNKQIEQLHKLLAREQELNKLVNDRLLQLEAKEEEPTVEPQKNQNTEDEHGETTDQEHIKAKKWWKFWK